MKTVIALLPTLFTLLSFYYSINQSYAQTSIDSAFSYQGELIDHGSPANSTYDFIFDAYNSETGNFLLQSVSVNDVNVENGLFSIPQLDFGQALLGNSTWLEIMVKKSNDAGTFETLLERQKINAVPYAYESEFSNNASLAQHALTSNTAAAVSTNGATVNDVYTFNGSQWSPQSNPWKQQASQLYILDHFIGIGTTTPEAKFTVNADSNVNKSLAIFNDGTEKFTVHQNGGSSIGFGAVPPIDGLYVEGSVQQKSSSNGLMKYMARVRCLASGSSVTSFYNGINNGSVTVSDIGVAGRCNINFPTQVNNRYWQISAVSDNGNHHANCHTISSNSQLRCQRTFSGVNNDGDIMILVY